MLNRKHCIGVTSIVEADSPAPPQGDWSDMADFAAATSFPYWGTQFGSAVRQRRLIRNLIGKVQADSIRYPSTDGLREMSEIRQFIVPTDKPKSTP